MLLMEKIMSCEISFIPIQSENYKNDVDRVIEIISSYKLEYQVGLLSTTVKGNKEIIFEMLQQICEKMYDKVKFTMVLKISNECGCNKG